MSAWMRASASPSPGAAFRTCIPPVLRRQHHLQRVVLAGRAEHVIRLLDLAQAEVVGPELVGLDAPVADELEQGRDRRAAYEARGDRDVLDPQLLEVQR